MGRVDEQELTQQWVLDWLTASGIPNMGFWLTQSPELLAAALRAELEDWLEDCIVPVQDARRTRRQAHYLVASSLPDPSRPMPAYADLAVTAAAWCLMREPSSIARLSEHAHRHHDHALVAA